MKIRLADYVADFLASHGVTDVFSVVGGGAMHLNDALGHHEKLTVTYNHHEQACAIAAEAYARLDNKIAALCVTTGPGGTNALTGVVGGWLDEPSLPVDAKMAPFPTRMVSCLFVRRGGGVSCPGAAKKPMGGGDEPTPARRLRSA